MVKEQQGTVVVVECSHAARAIDESYTLFDKLGLPETLATGAMAAAVASVLVRDYAIPAEAAVSMKELNVGLQVPDMLLGSLCSAARQELRRNGFIHQLERLPGLHDATIKVVPGNSRIRLVVKR